MDLTNKQIRIVNTAISSYPAKSVIHCQVLGTLSSDVREVIGSYELVFEEVFNGPDDPSLISAVSEKIQGL
jgi:hypothetical protein